MSERTYWRTLSRATLFSSKWYNLQQDQVALPNGAEITYTWVEHPGCAVVVPLTAEGNVVMQRQYRYTVNETLLELAAGAFNPEDADAPLHCAVRELREEQGLVAGRWTALGSFHTAIGISNVTAHAFLAEQLTEVDSDLEVTEQQAGFESVSIPFVEAVEMCYDGRISDGLTIIAMLRAARLRL